jgi:Gram-negative bacterial TonB protein C-terminal
MLHRFKHNVGTYSMPRRLKLIVSFAAVGLCVAWALVAQAAGPTSESPLLQTAHITGDAYEGFRDSCLIVYSDGRYHREWRRQVSQDGRPQDTWESPEVFEAQLGASEIERLRAIIEAPGFRSITGTVGNFRSPNSMLVFTPFGVIPHTDIEILTVSVAHPNGPQVFEVTATRVARRQEPLRAFLDWVKETEGRQASRLPASAANNCSSLLPTAGNAALGRADMATGFLYPTLIYAPKPQPPHNTPKPRPVMVELVINADGSVALASPEDRASPDVKQVVLDAVRKWKFQPARLLGVPVAVKIWVKIDF